MKQHKIIQMLFHSSPHYPIYIGKKRKEQNVHTNRSTTPTTYSRKGEKPLSQAAPKVNPSDFTQAPILDLCNSSLEDCIKELPFDDAYYIKNFGMDRRNYLIYKEMVAHTEKFCAAYLEAEMNGNNGYQPFFV